VAEPIEMSEAECETLLRLGVFGRIGFSAPGGIHIIPVNYSVVDDAIVVRTSAYSLLGTHGRGAVLAFEVDDLDREYQHGWSIQARGRSAVVSDAIELTHIREVWDPRPWADGSRELYLRLPWTELSGRRLGRGWSPVAELPYGRRVST
jgi:nitroimidazol reductase NimA-like FMN-containing flavoprotein (pyridoxamine 5'-phosphate oxidase superfamily)